MINEKTEGRPAAVSLTDVVCKHCGARNRVPQFRCFDTAWDSKAKEELFDGSFFQWTCPECQTFSEFVYPSQYLDREGKLCVVLRPGLETGCEAEALNEMNERLGGLGMTGIRHRAVGNFYGMQEQARIRGEGLDDRVVQLLKPLIIGQLQARKMQIWNGFFVEMEEREEPGPIDDVTYMYETGGQEEAHREPLLWFDIYLTDGGRIRQGINYLAYRLCGDILKKAGEGEDDGRYHLYDLSWAIGFHNKRREDS